MRLLLILLFAAPSLVAQETKPPAPPRPDAQIAAIERLAYMTGTWRGEGWMEFGGRRTSFRGAEVVQQKLGGTALLVEGSFFARPPGSAADIPVHTTLGVITFDPKSETYRFRSWLATGTTGERELIVTDDGWRWEIESPRGTTRYVARFTPDGEWIETGERSSGDGWQKFFEMKLRKE